MWFREWRLRILKETTRFWLSERGRQNARNAIFSSADFILLPILWLIFTPLFINRLGTDHYGIWMLANALIGMSGLASLGLSDATIVFVAKYRGLKDNASVSRVVRSTLSLYSLLGIVAGSVIYSVSPWLVMNTFKIDAVNISLSISVMRLGGLGIFFLFLDSTFQSALHGYERYDLAARVNMGKSVATIGINVLLVISGFELHAFLWANIFLLLLSALTKAYILKAYLLPSVLFLPLIQRSAFTEILEYGFFSWLQGIGGILFSQADRFLVVSMLGTTELAYYTVCLQVAQNIQSLFGRAASFLFPLATSISESGDQIQLRKLYYNGINLVTTGAVLTGLPIFMFSPEILTLWMGSDFASETSTLLRIMVFVAVLQSTSVVPYYYLNGVGYVRLNTLFGIVSGVIAIVLSFVFIPIFGLNGVALARLSSLSISVISRTVLHYRVLSERQWFAGAMTFLPVLVVFLLSAGYLLFRGSSPGGILSIIAQGVTALIVGSGITAGLGLLSERVTKPVRVSQ